MKRGILLAAAAVLTTTAVRAGVSQQELDRYRERMAQERARIEGSAGYKKYWDDGRKQWQELKTGTGQLPEARLPDVPEPGARAGEIAKLVEQLKTAKGAEKMEARNALSKIGPPAVKALAEALQSEDIAMRGSAAMVLRKVGASAMGAVLPLTDVKNRQVRSSAIGVVQKIIKKDHVGAVVAKLESAEHPDCRKGLVSALKRVVSAREAELVAALLMHAKDPALRAEMAKLAAASGSLKVMPALVELGKASDQISQRLGAYGAQVLLQRAQRGHIPLLYAAFNDSSGMVKTVIAATLQRLAGRNPAKEAVNEFLFMVYVRQNNVRWPPR